MTQGCPDCASTKLFGGGNGKCAACYGSGKVGTIADDIAGGKRNCSRCGGNGQCRTCHGTGVVAAAARPTEQKRQSPPPPKAAEPSATDLEKEWYGICNRSAFIPQHVLDYYIPALKARGKQVAIAVGLSDFHAHTCPKCGEQGQFKIRFLGRLEHPECQWTGYMGTGSYIGFQIAQIFHSGIRAGGSMKENSDNKGDRSGGWINGILVFLFVGIFRALLAVVLIPVHTLVALFQPAKLAPNLPRGSSRSAS